MPHDCFIGRAAFVLVGTSLSHITYQFVITNANNKRSPRDKNLRDTIIAYGALPEFGVMVF